MLNLTVYLARWKEEWIQRQRIRQKTDSYSTHQVTHRYRIQCRLSAQNSNPIPFHKLWVLYASDELDLWRWIKYFLYVCYEYTPYTAVYSAERIFYLLFITCSVQSSAYKGHTEKITDKFDLLRLQIPAFILMTLQNTLRSLIQICMKIPTLWFSVTAFGIFNVVK